MWCLYNDHCLDIITIIWSSINCPTVIHLPTVCYLSREKPLMKPTATGSSFSYICLRSTFPLHFYSDLLNQKYKNTLLHFILFVIYYFNLLQISGIFTRKGLTTPHKRRVAIICYLCAGTVYIVLLGPPTGLIPWFSKTEGNTYATLLHHPFLFGENQHKLKT